jgi:hypothetical protein
VQLERVLDGVALLVETKRAVDQVEYDIQIATEQLRMRRARAEGGTDEPRPMDVDEDEGGLASGVDAGDMPAASTPDVGAMRGHRRRASVCIFLSMCFTWTTQLTRSRADDAVRLGLERGYDRDQHQGPTRQPAVTVTESSFLNRVVGSYCYVQHERGIDVLVSWLLWACREAEDEICDSRNCRWVSSCVRWVAKAVERTEERNAEECLDEGGEWKAEEEGGVETYGAETVVVRPTTTCADLGGTPVVLVEGVAHHCHSCRACEQTGMRKVQRGGAYQRRRTCPQRFCQPEHR